MATNATQEMGKQNVRLIQGYSMCFNYQKHVRHAAATTVSGEYLVGEVESPDASVLSRRIIRRALRDVGLVNIFGFAAHPNSCRPRED